MVYYVDHFDHFCLNMHFYGGEVKVIIIERETKHT